MKTIKALRKFCLETRNVYQPIKAWAVELQSSCQYLNPCLVTLHNSIEVVDSELTQMRLFEIQRIFRESMVAGTSFLKLEKTVECASRVELHRIYSGNRPSIYNCVA